MVKAFVILLQLLRKFIEVSSFFDEVEKLKGPGTSAVAAVEMGSWEMVMEGMWSWSWSDSGGVDARKVSRRRATSSSVTW